MGVAAIRQDRTRRASWLWAAACVAAFVVLAYLGMFLLLGAGAHASADQLASRSSAQLPTSQLADEASSNVHRGEQPLDQISAEAREIAASEVEWAAPLPSSPVLQSVAGQLFVDEAPRAGALSAADAPVRDGRAPPAA
ncbi:MAG: hypothetical protein ABI200_05970 [Gaiellales bacterium]